MRLLNMKKKAGLHKKISSIFDGVPVPKSVQDRQHGLAVKEPEPVEVEENLYAQDEEPQTPPPIVQSPSSPPEPLEQSSPKSPPPLLEQSLPKSPPEPLKQSLPKSPPEPLEQSLPKSSPSPLERSLPKPPPEPRPSPQPRSDVASRPEPVDKPKEVPAAVRKVQVDSSPASLQMAKMLYLIKEKVYGDGDIEIDSKQKATTALVGVFAIVLVVVLVNVIKPPKRAGADSMADQQVPGQSGNTRIEWVMPEEIELKRNPMKFSGVSRVTQQGDIVVSGIVDGDQPMAIVSGGRILEVGDVIEGLTVKKITSEFVEFETADGEKLVRQVGQ
jgi:hypothetical protein